MNLAGFIIKITVRFFSPRP